MVGSIARFGLLGRVLLSCRLPIFIIGSKAILIFDDDELLLEPDLCNFDEPGPRFLADRVHNFDDRLFLKFLIPARGLNVEVSAPPSLEVEQFLSFNDSTDNISSQTHLFFILLQTRYSKTPKKPCDYIKQNERVLIYFFYFSNPTPRLTRKPAPLGSCTFWGNSNKKQELATFLIDYKNIPIFRNKL